MREACPVHRLGMAEARGYCAGLMPAFLITPSHIVTSAATSRWNCAPGMLVGSKPSVVSLSLISGIAATLSTASPSLSAIGYGVLIGTKNAVHTVDVMLG